MDAHQQQGTLRDRVESFCRSSRIDSLYVFGSRAGEIRGMKAHDALRSASVSDVDIGVKLQGNRRLSVREKAELAVALENLLGVDRIDLVLLAEADPFLAVNIIRGERLFSRDEDADDDYELYVLRRAGDLEPFERLRIERIMGHTERSYRGGDGTG